MLRVEYMYCGLKPFGRYGGCDRPLKLILNSASITTTFQLEASYQPRPDVRKDIPYVELIWIVLYLHIRGCKLVHFPELPHGCDRTISASPTPYIVAANETNVIRNTLLIIKYVNCEISGGKTANNQRKESAQSYFRPSTIMM